VILHPLTAFDKAPPDAKQKKTRRKKTQSPPDFSPKITAHDVSTDHQINLETLDKYGVVERIKLIIEHGKVPDEIKPGDDSGSVWQFEASCALVRCNVPDQLHYLLLVNKTLRWSDTIYRHGGAHYAQAQIANAKEEVANDVVSQEDDVVKRMNEEGCCVVNLKGKVRYVFQTPDTDHPTQKVDNFAEKAAFKDWFADETVTRMRLLPSGKFGPVPVPIGNIYVDHPEREKLIGMKFVPGKPRILPNKVLNTCSGFAVQPEEGDCSLFLEHCRDVICNKDPVLYKYLQGWMASTAQRPWDLVQPALIITSPNKGTGKSKWGEQFGSLFGRHFMVIADQRHLVGNFNAHTSELVLLMSDETYDLSDPEALGILNTRITAKTVPIEKKGIDVISAPNYCRFIVLSNDESPVKLMFDDRRFVILRASEHRKRDYDYFKALDEQMDNGGREALLHYLLNYPLEGFNPRDIPYSAEKDKLILANATVFEKIIISWAQQGVLPGALVGRYGKDGKKLQDRAHIAPSKVLYAALRESGDRKIKDASEVELSDRLDAFGFEPKGLGSCAGKEAPELAVLQAKLEARYPALKGTWQAQDWGGVPFTEQPAEAQEELGLAGGEIAVGEPSF
jgi:hypothetical protein